MKHRATGTRPTAAHRPAAAPPAARYIPDPADVAPAPPPAPLTLWQRFVLAIRNLWKGITA